MDSLNAPVPPSVNQLALDLRPWLSRCESIRENLSLVVKRLGARESSSARTGASHPSNDGCHRLRERIRPILADIDSIRVRVTGTGVFRTPPVGRGPVVYLAVESPGLVGLHDRLVREFGAVENLEGSEYTPHITLGRGGDPVVEDWLDVRIEPVTWTIHELHLWNREYRGPEETVPF